MEIDSAERFVFHFVSLAVSSCVASPWMKWRRIDILMLIIWVNVSHGQALNIYYFLKVVNHSIFVVFSFCGVSSF